ncbi:nitroreductase family protein [Alteribacillus sp. HJP-4]|uniref:nitroreductase family protein n=1 Tax=Alteribacillus sp. HJP-4 TaxID=2775394 RepID=UPI0035CCDC26
MEFQEIARKRREITDYKDELISDEVMKRIQDAAMLAPAGNNLPSREFIVVRSEKMLKHLEGATPFVPWLKKAKAAIVVTGRPDVSKYWLQDASIACSYIWLAAVDEGLGAAFGAIYHAQDAAESAKREQYVREALHIPADRKILAILGMGYPAEEKAPKSPPDQSELLHYEIFGG